MSFLFSNMKIFLIILLIQLTIILNEDENCYSIYHCKICPDLDICEKCAEGYILNSEHTKCIKSQNMTKSTTKFYKKDNETSFNSSISYVSYISSKINQYENLSSNYSSNQIFTLNKNSTIVNQKVRGKKSLLNESSGSIILNNTSLSSNLSSNSSLSNEVSSNRSSGSSSSSKKSSSNSDKSSAQNSLSNNSNNQSSSTKNSSSTLNITLGYTSQKFTLKNNISSSPSSKKSSLSYSIKNEALSTKRLMPNNLHSKRSSNNLLNNNNRLQNIPFSSINKESKDLYSKYPYILLFLLIVILIALIIYYYYKISSGKRVGYYYDDSHDDGSKVVYIR